RDQLSRVSGTVRKILAVDFKGAAQRRGELTNLFQRARIEGRVPAQPGRKVEEAVARPAYKPIIKGNKDNCTSDLTDHPTPTRSPRKKVKTISSAGALTSGKRCG